MHVFLKNETATYELGKKIAQIIHNPANIYLTGELGAGKSTFARGLIQGLGYEGKVKSPSYALIEPYEVHGIQIFHFDFYRIHDRQELAVLGIEEYFYQQAICVVEWPEKAENLLPAADLFLAFKTLENGREINIIAYTEQGTQWQDQIQKLQD
jgi:tRNA threonylcarbamoyladenosine biosynthesis protein TsaE